MPPSPSPSGAPLRREAPLRPPAPAHRADSSGAACHRAIVVFTAATARSSATTATLARPVSSTGDPVPLSWWRPTARRRVVEDAICWWTWRRLLDLLASPRAALRGRRSPLPPEAPRRTATCSPSGRPRSPARHGSHPRVPARAGEADRPPVTRSRSGHDLSEEPGRSIDPQRCGPGGRHVARRAHARRLERRAGKAERAAVDEHTRARLRALATRIEAEAPRRRRSSPRGDVLTCK